MTVTAADKMNLAIPVAIIVGIDAPIGYFYFAQLFRAEVNWMFKA